MVDAPFFSVVVPVFNKEPHIVRSLGSVFAQTYENFELIVVCDPSTDNSDIEVAKFQDPRIRIFQRHVPGRGGYAARNLGVKMASTKWIAFLDADDEWMPDHLEKMFHLINKFRDCRIFSAGWKVIDGAKNYVDKFSILNSDIPDLTLSLKDYVWYEVQGARPIWTSVACVHRDLFQEVGGFPEDRISMGGDVDAWIRCVNLIGNCVWSNHIGAIYHRDSINMVTRNSVIYPDLHLTTAHDLLRLNKSKKVRDLIKIRTNDLIFSAWINNMGKSPTENFKLLGKPFPSVQSFKVFLYVSFSMLPLNIQGKIYKIVEVLVKNNRRFWSN